MKNTLTNKPANIIITGLGRIGCATAKLLIDWKKKNDSAFSNIFFFDSPEVLNQLRTVFKQDYIKFLPVSLESAVAQAKVATGTGHLVIINSLPCHLTTQVANLAQDSRTQISYFDYTEDIASRRQIEELSKQKFSRFMPQCGLAPGFTAILGAHLAGQLSHQEGLDLFVSVGALSDPESSQNPYSYAWSWSPEGVVNEYFKPSEIIKNSQMCKVNSLDGLANYKINFQNETHHLEAFYTSGGLGSLPETLCSADANVNSIEYKSLRYPGHHRAMKIATALVPDPQCLTSDLKRLIPLAKTDQVFIIARARNSDGESSHYTNIIQPSAELSAIQLTTACGLLAMVQLELEEKLPAGFFIRPESISWKDFSSTLFAAPYLNNLSPENNFSLVTAEKKSKATP